MRCTLPIISMVIIIPAESFSSAVELLCQFWIGTLDFRLSILGRQQNRNSTNDGFDCHVENSPTKIFVRYENHLPALHTWNTKLQQVHPLHVGRARDLVFVPHGGRAMVHLADPRFHVITQALVVSLRDIETPAQGA
jgi:hypothetical protein